MWKPLLLSGTVLASLLAVHAEENPEILREIGRIYAEQQPEMTPRVRFIFPPRDGLVRADVLVSQKKAGCCFVRNRLDQIYFRDGKIATIKHPGSRNSDFWSAVLAADRVLRIESGDQGRKLRFFDAATGPEVAAPELSASCRNAMRNPGGYLLPQPETCRPLPVFPPNELEEFRNLPPEREAAWLRNRLEALPPSPEALALLERLAAIGEFLYPLPAADRERWKSLLLNEKLGVAPRRFLQSQLFEANFLPQPEFAAELLKDPVLGEATAERYSERNRAGFETLMLAWGNDPALRNAALEHSSRMAGNPLYRRKMLDAFPKPDPEQRLLLVPVYAEEYRGRESGELKEMLAAAHFSGGFRQLLVVAEWIWRTDPAPYAAEIGQLLRRERNNRDLERSVVYPLLLASLCRAGDADGIRASIVYLKKLDDPARIANAKRIWGGKMTGQVTLERIIDELDK